MAELYRKRGSIVRYENGALLRATEAGEATEDDGVFRCRPWRDASRLPFMEAEGVTEVARQIEALAGGNVAVERVIAAEGRAEHECEGRTWADVNRRLHVSVTNGSHRLLLDEGTFDTAALGPLVERFARIGVEREAPPRLRLLPRVVGALMHSLIDVAPPNVTFEQTAGDVDGKGVPVHAVSRPPWPNFYRPSYRVRPRRLPFHLALRCSVTAVERDLPEAVAVLAPAAGASIRVLCVDGAAVFPASIRIARIDGVTEPAAWFPFGAGVWAGEAEVATSR